MTSTIPTTISFSCLRTLALCPICLTVWTMLMCFIKLLAADLPWTYLLSRSIILPHLSLVLYLTILSSFYAERCSHIVLLSSSSASWLAQCGFGCLEFCVRSSQSVTSCASLTLREAGTCTTRSCIYCLFLYACTICSVASPSPFLVRAFVRLCPLMDCMQTPPGITEGNQSYYTGNSFSVPHSVLQALHGTPGNSEQLPAFIQEVNAPTSSGVTSSPLLSSSAVSSQATVAPTRNGTGGVMLRSLNCSSSTASITCFQLSSGGCCADDYTLQRLSGCVYADV